MAANIYLSAGADPDNINLTLSPKFALIFEKISLSYNILE